MELRRRWLAQLRGVFVGAFAGAAGLAGHGLGGGASEIDSGAILLLIAVCALPGLVAASDRTRGRGALRLLLLLLGGQALAHFVLGVAAGHALHTLAPSSTMLVAHLTVTAVAVVGFLALEQSLLVAFGVVVDALTHWLLRPPRPAGSLFVPALPPAPTPRGVRGRWQSYGGTRGPPAFA